VFSIQCKIMFCSILGLTYNLIYLNSYKILLIFFKFIIVEVKMFLHFSLFLSTMEQLAGAKESAATLVQKTDCLWSVQVRTHLCQTDNFVLLSTRMSAHIFTLEQEITAANSITCI
jgi:hypothetical protein